MATEKTSRLQAVGPLVGYGAMAVVSWLSLAASSLRAAVVAAILLLLGIPILAWLMKARHRRIANAMPGALLVTPGTVRFRDVRGPQFQGVLANVRHSWLLESGGRVEVTDERILFRPGKRLGLRMLPVAVAWGDVANMELSREPMKVNIARLELGLIDGSRVVMKAQGYARLDRALKQVPKLRS